MVNYNQSPLGVNLSQRLGTTGMQGACGACGACGSQDPGNWWDAKTSNWGCGTYRGIPQDQVAYAKRAIAENRANNALRMLNEKANKYRDKVQQAAYRNIQKRFANYRGPKPTKLECSNYWSDGISINSYKMLFTGKISCYYSCDIDSSGRPKYSQPHINIEYPNGAPTPDLFIGSVSDEDLDRWFGLS